MDATRTTESAILDPRESTAIPGVWVALLPVVVLVFFSGWQIGHTVGVTEDTTNFLLYARQLGGDSPWPGLSRRDIIRPEPATPFHAKLFEHLPRLAVIHGRDQHPGYPLSILAVHRLCGSALAHEPELQWLRAGQLVSLLGGVLVVLGVFSLGRDLVGGRGALVVSLMLAASPAMIRQSADALSDAPALALLVWSGFFGLRALRRSSLRLATVAGLCGAVGYLFRPEAIQLVVLVGVALCIMGLRGHPTSRARSIAMSAAILIGPILVCGSYAILKGGLLTKSTRLLGGAKAERTPTTDNRLAANSTSDTDSTLARWVVPVPRRGNSTIDRWLPWLREGTLARTTLRGLRRFFEGWSHNVGWLVLALVLLGSAPGCGRHLDTVEGRILGGMFACNMVLLVGVLFVRKGYLDTRHLWPVSIVTIFWVWLGIRTASAWLLRSPRFSGRRVVLGAGLVLAVVLGTCCSSALRPLHGERVGHRLAGEWIRTHGPSDGQLFDGGGMVSFYAGHADRSLFFTTSRFFLPPEVDKLPAYFPYVKYFVFEDRNLREMPEVRSTIDSVEGRLLKCVQTFPVSDDPDCPYRVRIYKALWFDGETPRRAGR